MSKCPITGNDCNLEDETLERFLEAGRQNECLDAHYRKDVQELILAAQQAIEILKVRDRIGMATVLQIARDATIDRISNALETLATYEETDDPKANGWVGQDGLP